MYQQLINHLLQKQNRNLKAKRGSKKTETKKEVLGKIKKEKCKLKVKFTKLRKEINEWRKKQLLLKEKHIRAKELSAKLTLLAGELRELMHIIFFLKHLSGPET